MQYDKPVRITVSNIVEYYNIIRNRFLNTNKIVSVHNWNGVSHGLILCDICMQNKESISLVFRDMKKTYISIASFVINTGLLVSFNYNTLRITHEYDTKIYQHRKKMIYE
jgi:hypothetical protein